MIKNIVIVILSVACIAALVYIAVLQPLQAVDQGISIQNRSMHDQDEGITRYYDPEADVICWFFVSEQDVAAFCMPRRVTDY